MAFVLADPTLSIGSSSDCPAASAVATEIAPLLPAGARVATASSPGGRDDDDDRDAGRGDTLRADIVDDGGRRWVQLSGGDGRLIDRRELPLSLGCQEAARAAAVLLAAWQFQGRSALPPTPADVPVASPASPASAADTELRRTALPLPPSAPRNELGLGAGFAVGRGAAQFVGSAMVEILVGRPEGLGLRLHAARTSLYDVPVASGRAEWRRTSLGLGGTLTGRHGGWGGRVEGDLLGAVLSISGDGYAVNETSSQLLLGGAVAGRVIRRVGRADLWLGLTLNVWPGRHQVFLRDAPENRDLPTFEAAAEAGVDFVVWP